MELGNPLSDTNTSIALRLTESHPLQNHSLLFIRVDSSSTLHSLQHHHRQQPAAVLVFFHSHYFTTNDMFFLMLAPAGLFFLVGRMAIKKEFILNQLHV